MDKQKLVIVLLVVAIIFSIVSVAITLSVGDFKIVQPSQPNYKFKFGGGVPNANLGLVVEGAGGAP